MANRVNWRNGLDAVATICDTPAAHRLLASSPNLPFPLKSSLPTVSELCGPWSFRSGVKGIKTVKRNHLSIACLILCSIFLSTVSVSAEESFFNKLNPFKKKDPAPVKVSLTDKPKTVLSWPQWKPIKMPWSGPSFTFTPTWVSSNLKPPSFSATWGRMSRGSKDFYNKSKTVFMPWSKPAISQRPPTGSRGVYRAVPKNTPAKKKSFFSSLFSSQPEPPNRNRTVGEFLSQERPQP